jgi:hypothetical protein
MATINIQGKQLLATVDQKEVVANSNTLNYISNIVTTPPVVSTTTIPEPDLNLKVTGMDENAIPTTIRSRSEGDWFNITDILNRTVNYKRTFTDLWTAGDTFSRIVIYRRTAPETTRVSQETTTFRVNSLKLNTVNVAESSLKSARIVRTDQANAAQVTLKNIKPTLLDTINAIQEFRLLTLKILKTDEINTTDLFSRVVSWYRTFTEIISVTDDYLGNANIDDDQYATFIKAVLVGTQITDFVTKQVEPLNLEQVNIGDGKFIAISAPKTDSVNVSDLFARVVDYKRAQLDQINVAQVNLKTLQKPQANSANVSDLRFITAELLKTNNLEIAETTNKLISTIYLENIDVSEFIAKNYSKPDAELINVTDPVFKTVSLLKTENIIAAETTDKLISTIYLENIDVSEFIAKNYSKPDAELINVTDSVFKTVSLLKTNNFEVTDQFSKLVAYSRLFIDQVTVTDDYQGAANIDDDQYVAFGKAVIDLINLPEYIAKNIAKPLDTDQVNILETKFVNIAVLKTDDWTAGDVVSKIIETKPSIFVNISEQQYKSFSTSFLDNITVTDSVEKLSTLLKLNSVDVTDSFSRTVNYLRTLVDQVNVTDDYLGSADVDDDQYIEFGKRVIDQINIVENILKNIDKPLATDQVNILETKFVNIALPKTDAWTVAEEPFKNIGVNFTKVINIVEIFTRTANYLRTIEESGGFDYLMLENLSDFLLLENSDFLVTETSLGLSISDVIQVSRLVSLADQFNILDTPLKRIGKILTDQINTSDSFTRTVNYLRTLTDQINTTDDYLGNANIDDDQYVGFGKRIADIVNFAENSYKSTAKILQHIANVSDQRYLNPRIIRIDLINSTDTISLFKYRNQFNFEQIYVSSSGNAYLQNYFQNPAYVENGYVGTITTFT